MSEIIENTDNMIWVCSIDIGKKNFAFYVEEMNLTKLQQIKNIPKLQRYNINGTTTSKMQVILDKVCQNGRTIRKHEICFQTAENNR